MTIIATHPPSLVILDINMPCIDGWTVLRELTTRMPRPIPVIVVTGEDALRVTAQAAAILRKPVPAEVLLPLVAHHLRAS